jgi:hypothetical protein
MTLARRVLLFEYLWKEAYGFHPLGSEQAEAWVAERALQILKGHASAVAGGICRRATLRGLSAKERDTVDECTEYLQTNMTFKQRTIGCLASISLGPRCKERSCLISDLSD